MTSPIDYSALFRVDGLVAFVTGASSGLGVTFAKILIQNGAKKVYIGGRRLDRLEQVAASLGDNVIPILCDVKSRDDIKKAAEIIENDTGYLNLVICNAGIGGPQPAEGVDDLGLEEFADQFFAHDMDEYTDTFRVNVAGAWFTAIGMLKLLDKGNKQGNLQQSSQVLVISSVAGFAKTVIVGAAYPQSKAAANAIVKQLSRYLPPHGIRVNGLAPGYFPSEINESFLCRFRQPDGSMGPVPKTWIPEGRLGQEKDLAGFLLYMTSPAGAYCSGNITLVDGAIMHKMASTF